MGISYTCSNTSMRKVWRRHIQDIIEKWKRQERWKVLRTARGKRHSILGGKRAPIK